MTRLLISNKVLCSLYYYDFVTFSQFSKMYHKFKAALVEIALFLYVYVVSEINK